MSKLTCPNCEIEMTRTEDGDIATDVCSTCDGVFLDRGELNALATGIQGNIEYCSIDKDFHQDRFPARTCPQCPDKVMRKVNLLRLSDIIFDYCPACEGFFLDKREVEKMNAELKSLAPSAEAEEYRATEDGHLVRVDQTGDVVALDFLGITTLANARYIRVSVFFSKEMPKAMRVFQETWPMRLAKSVGLFWGQDIETGDADFDKHFRVKGEDEEAISAHLDPVARQALLAFAEGHRTVSGRAGSLEITSSGIAYVEGPYVPASVSDVVDKAKPVIAELIQIADKIEALPAAS